MCRDAKTLQDCKIWYNRIQIIMIWCIVMQYDTVWCDAIQYDIWYNLTRSAATGQAELEEGWWQHKTPVTVYWPCSNHCIQNPNTWCPIASSGTALFILSHKKENQTLVCVILSVNGGQGHRPWGPWVSRNAPDVMWSHGNSKSQQLRKNLTQFYYFAVLLTGRRFDMLHLCLKPSVYMWNVGVNKSGVDLNGDKTN